MEARYKMASLVELAEKEIEKAKPVGRPRIISVEYPDVEVDYKVELYHLMILREIKRRAPKNANAFSRGKEEELDRTSPYFDYAVQYYQIKREVEEVKNER